MIEIKNITKSFGSRKLFDKFSLNIKDGDFVIFMGKSGCGKTTLLNIIGSLEEIDSGEILVDGEDISKKKDRRNYLKYKVGFLFQNFALADNKTVEENLNFIKNDCRSGVSIDEALKEVGLENARRQKIYQLSGGEQQRVALARLMIKKCDYILADEPTGSLDRENANLVFRQLERFNERGKTVIMVTHDEYFKDKGKNVVML